MTNFVELFAATGQAPARGIIRKALFAVIGSGLALGASFASAQAADVNNDVNYARDVIYEIVTDRFTDGNPGNNPTGALFSAGCANLRAYCGGDWAGIIQRIQDGYLTQMGVGALWISAPVENVTAVVPTTPGDIDSGATSYHGFWARDFKRTNPFFGTFADFDRLISVAHAAGIKIVIDFVPNHTSPSREGNAAFVEDGRLLDNGTLVASINNDPSGRFNHYGASTFANYDDSVYRTIFNLGDLNHLNPTIDAYLKSAINLWLDRGVDGIRVDTARHFPPGWARSWTDSLYARRPVYVFGEWFLGAGQTDPDSVEFANQSGMSIIDFRFANGVRAVLRDRNSTWAPFDAYLKESQNSFNEVVDQATFIDNLDIARFHQTGADTRNTDIALALLLTSRGTPIVYYGTEQYLTGNTDPENRRFMTNFDRTSRAYNVIRILSGLRRTNPAIGYGDTRQRWISSDVYIYERRFGNNVVMTAINRATTGATSITGLLTALPAGTYADQLGGLLNGGAINVSASGAVTPFSLGAGQVAVWSFTSAGATPLIGHVGPVTARVGQTITINGEGFGANAGSVLFGATLGQVVSWSSSEVRVIVPNVGAGEYNVTVRNAAGVTSAIWDRFEIRTAAQIPVRFIVNNATTVPGQNIYLTGSVAELANFSTSTSAAIGPFFNQVVRQYPTWYYDVSLPAGQTVQYKFLRVDANGTAVFEGGANHVYVVPTSGTGQVVVNFQP